MKRKMFKMQTFNFSFFFSWVSCHLGLVFLQFTNSYWNWICSCACHGCCCSKYIEMRNEHTVRYRHMAYRQISRRKLREYKYIIIIFRRCQCGHIREHFICEYICGLLHQSDSICTCCTYRLLTKRLNSFIFI